MRIRCVAVWPFHLSNIFQALGEILEKQKPALHKLAEETKALEKNLLPDVENTYKQEFSDAQEKWNKLKVTVSEDLRLLEETASKLRAFEVNSGTIRSLLYYRAKGDCRRRLG